MLRGRPANQGLSLSKQIAMNGVMVMSQRKGSKGYPYRHASSPGLTPTHRRGVGRQGARSPRLVVMP